MELSGKKGLVSRVIGRGRIGRPPIDEQSTNRRRLVGRRGQVCKTEDCCAEWLTELLTED
jgi:hypothetical protein